MDLMMRKWHRYHYKNLTYLGISILIAVLLFRNQSFRELLFHLGNLGYMGALIGGVLFVSTFTVSVGVIILMFLAETMNPIEIGVIAGIGAVIGDLAIFHYIRNRGLINEIIHFFEYFGADKISHLLHTKYFSWTLPVIGALIIASPLPDELGVSLMGISRMKTSNFVIFSFILNALGIFFVVSVGSIIRP